MKNLNKLLIALCLLTVFSIFDLNAQETITVQASQQLDSSTKFMQGFLHGGPLYLDSVKVSKLKPAFWRLGSYWLAGGGYAETKRFNPKITIVINDLFMIAYNIPSQSLSQPWINNWQDWDTLVSAIAYHSINNNQPVDEWDVFGEPDNWWTGTYADWIEMYRRTDSILTSIIPNAKVTGPEFGFPSCDFQINWIVSFLDSLYGVGGSVSGVSWNEFCAPEIIPSHVQQVRDSLAVRPWLGNLEIFIPEYAGPGEHIIPGWNVGWLYYFEKAKVDWVSHACWNESDGINNWSDCQFGLNGLFMFDNTTPQPNYWVHRAYAELDSIRIVANSSHPKTVALSSKDNANQEIKILVGRYDNPNLGFHNAPSNVEIQVKNYPYCSNCSMPYTIQRIPSNNVPYSIPLNSPVTMTTGILTFTSDSASITINGFVDGDAYIIYINPSPGSILTVSENKVQNKGFSVFPNPANSNLNIVLNETESATFQIFNPMGVVIKEFTLMQSGQVEISDLANGLYFIRNFKFPYQTQKFIKQ